jgi:CubicO group peptidase (beta-lactamase class C family)
MEADIRWLWSVVCLLAIGACAPVPSRPRHIEAVEDARQTVLDRDMPRLLRETGVPSVSIAHIEGGRIVLAATYGSRSPGVPATPDTLYNIASLTKPVSAEVILRLASQGRVELDEPMYRYWIDPDIARDKRHVLLTPRLALSHQTGFPNWRSQTRNVLTFEHAPGEVAGYSGEGYEYVARFAAKKTGTGLEALARTLIFEPAGMRDTAFTGQPWFTGRVATPTDGEGKALEPSIRSEPVASDDVHTTASDYARFMISAMNREGLAEGIARERERIQVSTKARNCVGKKAATCPDGMGFGLGWEILQFRDDTILWHTGSDRGEFTFAWFSPRRRNGSVILTNSAVGYKVVLDVLERLGTQEDYLRFLRAQAGG